MNYRQSCVELEAEKSLQQAQYAAGTVYPSSGARQATIVTIAVAGRNVDPAQRLHTSPLLSMPGGHVPQANGAFLPT